MDLSSKIKAHNTTAYNPRCGVSVVKETLNSTDTLGLTEALRDPRITGVAIAQALQSEGYKISAFVIQKHRRDQCSCGDTE